MLHATAFRIEPPDVARIVETLTDPNGTGADDDALRCVGELGPRNRQGHPADDYVVPGSIRTTVGELQSETQIAPSPAASRRERRRCSRWR